MKIKILFLPLILILFVCFQPVMASQSISYDFTMNINNEKEVFVSGKANPDSEYLGIMKMDDNINLDFLSVEDMNKVLFMEPVYTNSNGEFQFYVELSDMYSGNISFAFQNNNVITKKVFNCTARANAVNNLKADIKNFDLSILMANNTTNSYYNNLSVTKQGIVKSIIAPYNTGEFFNALNIAIIAVKSTDMPNITQSEIEQINAFYPLSNYSKYEQLNISGKGAINFQNKLWGSFSDVNNALLDETILKGVKFAENSLAVQGFLTYLNYAKYDNYADKTSINTAVRGKSYDNIPSLKNDIDNIIPITTPPDNGKTGGGGFGVPIIKSFDKTQNVNVDSVTIVEALPFPDLATVPWAVNAVSVLKNKGIVNGYLNNIFAPDKNVTRAEFVTMLIKSFKFESKELKIGFTDVISSDWYYDYIMLAKAYGLIDGVGDRQFEPNSPITRQDMCVMAERFARYCSVEFNNGENNFIDKNNIDNYAVRSVNALNSSKIVNGYDDSSFKPQNTSSRAEISIVIYNLLNLAKLI